MEQGGLGNWARSAGSSRWIRDLGKYDCEVRELWSQWSLVLLCWEQRATLWSIILLVMYKMSFVVRFQVSKISEVIRNSSLHLMMPSTFHSAFSDSTTNQGLLSFTTSHLKCASCCEPCLSAIWFVMCWYQELQWMRCKLL